MKFILLAFLIFLSLPAAADEQVTAVQEGDIVPFDGTCFNIEAAARILTELEHAEESCKIKIEKEVALKSAEYDLKISNLEASLNSCNNLCDQRLQIYKDQSIYLQDQLKKQKQLHPAWAFVGGVLVGSAISVTTTYAVIQITQK